MHDFIQGCDSSAFMAKVLGKIQYQGKKEKMGKRKRNIKKEPDCGPVLL